MTTFDWSDTKSRRLKKTRGVSFEEIIQARVVDVIHHPSRENQHLIIFERRGYCWAVPCVEKDDGWFLKTLYPSRKFTKIYLGRRGHYEEG